LAAGELAAPVELEEEEELLHPAAASPTQAMDTIAAVARPRREVIVTMSST
jgi:hypothetical protein